MKLETIIDDLRAIAQLEDGTLQHWDELSRDQTDDASFGEQDYWVADYPQYGKKGDEPMLYLARLEHNLVLRHLFDERNSSWEQLFSPRTGYFFHPNLNEAQEVIEAASTLSVPLRALRLRGREETYRFLQIRTEDGFVNTSTDPKKARYERPKEARYERPVTEEQQLLERVGYTSAFLKALRTSRWSIQATNLYVLDPDFALHVAAEGSVGQAAWRNYFGSGAYSGAGARNVYFHLGALRGVRRVVAP